MLLPLTHTACWLMEPPCPATHPRNQVEYSINDGGRPWHHHHPRSYERLLRRLLALPSRPLVLGLMMHSFHRHQVGGRLGCWREADGGRCAGWAAAAMLACPLVCRALR